MFTIFRFFSEFHSHINTHFKEIENFILLKNNDALQVPAFAYILINSLNGKVLAWTYY